MMQLVNSFGKYTTTCVEPHRSGDALAVLSEYHLQLSPRDEPEGPNGNTEEGRAQGPVLAAVEKVLAAASHAASAPHRLGKQGPIILSTGTTAMRGTSWRSRYTAWTWNPSS